MHILALVLDSSASMLQRTSTPGCTFMDLAISAAEVLISSVPKAQHAALFTGAPPPSEWIKYIVVDTNQHTLPTAQYGICEDAADNLHCMHQLQA